jgi:NAD+ synthase
MSKAREFDPAEQVIVIENFIKQYFAENGTPETKAVIGISGGKDSTIAAALLVRTLGPDRVIGVIMPESVQTDIDDSRKVCEILGIKSFEIDIGPACEKLYKNFQDCTCGELMVNPQIRTNTPARIRMATLYMVAAAVGGRVCNTGNASEAFIGYTTKYGDLAGDFALLKNLTVREIYAIGDYLELPLLLVHKHPADGMSGKTDEENTGIPYDAIDDFLLRSSFPPLDVYEKMVAAHKRNRHKNVIQLPAPQRTNGYLSRLEHDCCWDNPWEF